MSKISDKIEKKTGNRNSIDIILEKLSGSELNSWLLELFKRRAGRISPSEILNEFKSNRFVIPSSLDAVEYLQEEAEWLKCSRSAGFEPVLLSPLTPLGTCSAVAPVNQNNIVSAARGTEVVSDSTNVLAFLAASLIRNSKRELLKYSTTQRQTRGQSYSNPAFTAHFGLFCMVTAGRDTGDYNFELQNLEDHLSFYYNMLTEKFEKGRITLNLYTRDYVKLFNGRLKELIRKFADMNGLKFRVNKPISGYYNKLQFKYFVDAFDTADGGFTDWTQKMLSDRKQRLIISAGSLDMILKIRTNMVSVLK